MATKIRLIRLGKKRAPYYRIVIADSRTKRDGRVIETIGKYHPKDEPSLIQVDSERAQYWLGVGAQPTEPVAALLKITGDWQRFKGLPAPDALKTAPPKADRKAVFEAAAKEAAGLSGGEDATTPRKRAPRAKAEPAAEAAAEAPAPAETGGETDVAAGSAADAAAEPAAAASAPTTDSDSGTTAEAAEPVPPAEA